MGRLPWLMTPILGLEANVTAISKEHASPNIYNADNVFLLQITSDKNAAFLRADSDRNSAPRGSVIMEVNAAKRMQPCLLCYDMEETDKDTLLTF